MSDAERGSGPDRRQVLAGVALAALAGVFPAAARRGGKKPVTAPVIKSVTFDQPSGYAEGAAITATVLYSGTGTTSSSRTGSGAVIQDGVTGTETFSATDIFPDRLSVSVFPAGLLAVASDDHVGKAVLTGTAGTAPGPAAVTVTVTDAVTGAATSAPAAWTVLAPPAPAPAAVTILFGVNSDVDGGLAAFASTLGIPQVTATKMFYQKVITARPPVPSGVTPLICIKTSIPVTATDQANLAALCRTLRPGDMLTNWQEDEHSGFTPAQMLAAHEACVAVFDSNAPSGAKYVQCLMTWDASGFSSHGPLNQWVATRADGRPLDLYGFDTYPNTSSSSARSVLDAALAELKLVVPSPVVGITECNYTTSLSSGITYTAGPPADFINGAFSWAQAHAAKAFILYYLTAHGVPWPPDQATINALKVIAAAATGT